MTQQREWLSWLRAQGHRAEVWQGHRAMLDDLRAYLAPLLAEAEEGSHNSVVGREGRGKG